MTTIFENIDQVFDCPHCKSVSITRHGKTRNKQRYRCKTCKKTFIASTGTPLHGLHKTSKLEKYYHAIYKGLSVREAARYVKISKNTSFAWRHKLLASLNSETIINENTSVCAITEIQQEYSAKGRKKTPEQNRSRTRTLLIKKGTQISLQKLQAKSPKKHIIKILSQAPPHQLVIQIPSKLLTASTKTCLEKQLYSKKDHIHLAIKTQKKSISQWMQRFKGVASKYLQQYWNWYTAIHNTQNMKNVEEFFKTNCATQRCLSTYIKLKNI